MHLFKGRLRGERTGFRFGLYLYGYGESKALIPRALTPVLELNYKITGNRSIVNFAILISNMLILGVRRRFKSQSDIAHMQVMSLCG